LISNRKLNKAVVETLNNKPTVLLQNNSQMTVGKSIPKTVMMAIYLEEAAEILYSALQIGMPIPLTANESAEQQLEVLPRVDLERAWNYFKNRALGNRPFRRR